MHMLQAHRKVFLTQLFSSGKKELCTCSGNGKGSGYSANVCIDRGSITKKLEFLVSKSYPIRRITPSSSSIVSSPSFLLVPLAFLAAAGLGTNLASYAAIRPFLPFVHSATTAPFPPFASLSYLTIGHR